MQMLIKLEVTLEETWVSILKLRHPDWIHIDASLEDVPVNVLLNDWQAEFQLMLFLDSPCMF